MKDPECVQFLQWALPQLKMRWPGFRRVRKQVCKRLQKRLDELQLENIADYQAYLAIHGKEWGELDKICRVTISRFYRDKMVFAFLQEQVFPRLINTVCQQRDPVLRIWCAGCGSGEEPYTLALLWDMCFADSYPFIRPCIIGTDSNPRMLERAKLACYPYSSVKNLPGEWLDTAFEIKDKEYCLKEKYKTNTQFLCQDIRRETPHGPENTPFHLICCRNLAFTYFDENMQDQSLRRIHASLNDDGVLLIGVHEALPAEQKCFRTWSRRLGVYLKTEDR
jgi:chemotaxis protein methyltransferase CheR